MNQNMEKNKVTRLKNCTLFICRVCLSTSVKKCMSLFETIDNHYLFEYINSLANVEIREGDGLPDRICPECILDLKTVINFKNKCEKSDSLLRTSLDETGSSNGHFHLDDFEEEHNVIKGEVTYVSDITSSSNGHSHLDDVEEEHNIIKGEVTYASDIDDDVKEEHNVIKGEATYASDITSSSNWHSHLDDVEEEDNIIKDELTYAIDITSSSNGHSHLDDVEEEHNIIKCEVTCPSDITFDDTNEPSGYVLPVVSIPTTQSVIKKLKTISATKSASVFKSRAIDLQLECNECGGKFTSKCKLRVHWKRVHLPSFLTCQYCKKKLGSVIALNQHRNGGSKFCSLAKLGKFNIEGEWKFRVFHCKDCDYKTHRTQDIRYHIYTHSGEKPFHCKLCPAKFAQYASLDSHKETVHKIVKHQITCQYCGKLVAGRTQVYRHLKHHMDSKLQCDVCKKVLKNRKSLEVHMLLHSGAKMFACDLCAQSFYTSPGLKNHKRYKHNDLFYQCGICEYKASKKQSVLKHERNHLSSNFPCLVCGRFFDSKSELVKHSRIHIDDGKLQCPHCEKKFVNKKSLGKHVKLKHKIELVCKGIGDRKQK